ncbi:MAG: SRPBCC family protein [Limisphaerales bacterium]
MLTTVLILVAIAIVIVITLVAMRPDDFRVTRSTTVAAPSAVVFAQVNDFHKWEAWSPWAKLDPACKNSFEGATAGKGAIFSWDGNKKVGAGRMTIIESRPSDLVRIRLEFFRPFKAVNTTEFTFIPDSDQTVVNWSMFGKNNFMGKAVGLFMNCDKMVGGDFEKGLATMKSVAEAGKV